MRLGPHCLPAVAHAVAFPFLAAACPDASDSRTAPGPASAEVVAVADAGAVEGVRLVVHVGVDQLRSDLLDRYDTVFTGGFARLRAEGLRFSSATFETSGPPSSDLPAWTFRPWSAGAPST
jgi:hypothetical protein